MIIGYLVVFTLGLGIGAAAAMLGLIQAGVTHAAFVWGLPLTGNKWTADVQIVGESGSQRLADQLSLPLRSVTPDYFDAVGIMLLEGRGFRQTDAAYAPPVAIVNEAMARRHFAGSDPVRRQLQLMFNDDPVEIIGVVRDMRSDSLSREAPSEIYLSLWQSSAYSKHLIVRTASDPSTLAGRVREELRRIDPTVAIEYVTTLASVRREWVATRVFATRLLSGFAVAATLLALVGLYGVLSLSVGLRTKEIAVRKAVGAQQRSILALVLGEGGRLIEGGVAPGLLISLALGRTLDALLFEVEPTDPLPLIAVATLFTGVALAICAVPAWRAARVDLMEPLRYD